MSRHRSRLALLAGLCAGLLCLIPLGILLRSSSTSTSTAHALCALRDDVQSRVTQGNAFLKTHPNGFAGISAPTLKSSIDNSQRTVDALGSLKC